MDKRVNRGRDEEERRIGENYESGTERAREVEREE